MWVSQDRIQTTYENDKIRVIITQSADDSGNLENETREEFRYYQDTENLTLYLNQVWEDGQWVTIGRFDNGYFPSGLLKNECTTTLSEVINSISSIETENIEVVLFPNPASEELNISLKTPLIAKEAKIIVTDQNAKIIDAFYISNKDNIKLNLLDYNSGIYNVSIFDSKRYTTKRFIIVK